MNSKLVFDECGGNCEDCDKIFFKKQKEGMLLLTKKKITKKYVPPDISAIKVLTELDYEDEKLYELTDKEIDEKINEIVNLIKEQKND